jgi:spore coat polysaccharide biosynthesis protein SpsF
VVAEATRLGVETVRGSEQDVLARYAAAALESRADAVVRVTSDCPLLDPSVTESVVRRYLDERCACDYASNTIVRSYPRGLDVEVFSAAALASAAEEAVAPEEREHVTLFFHNNASRFSRSSLVNARDLSGHRWTLDTEEDYRFLSEVFREFPIGVGSIPSFQEVVSFLDGRPAIVAINAGIRQKPVSRELNS